MDDLDDDLLDASEAATPEEWVARIAAIGEAGGWFRPLAADHQALFLDNGRSLLVTFDTHRAAFERPRKLLVGMDLADECDWSHLCLLARKHPWFRSDSVWAFFDEMIDEGFFERFDRVLFYGGGLLRGRGARRAGSAVEPGRHAIARPRRLG